VKSGVLRVAGVAAIAAFVLVLVGCGSGTPDTEGQTLAQAQQTLRDAGVPDENITVTGENGDPNQLIVCDHDPDGVSPSQPVTLEVARNCPQDDDSDRKRKKRTTRR
jgi:beta-lactam-binding protein with PASTA domain